MLKSDLMVRMVKFFHLLLNTGSCVKYQDAVVHGKSDMKGSAFDIKK